MASGLKLVRQALGPDALILSTRTIRTGKLGLLSKPTLEITAAIDSPQPRDTTGYRQAGPPARPFFQGPAKTVKKKNGGRINLAVDDQLSLDYGAFTDQPAPADRLPSEALTFRSAPMEQEPATVAPVAAPPATGEDERLRSEVDELKNLVNSLVGELAKVTKPSPAPATASEAPRPEQVRLPANKLDSLKTIKDPVLKMLNRRGVNGETATALANFARDTMPGVDLLDEEKIRSFLVQTIYNLIEVQPPDFSPVGPQQRIALVGPTGVGKTTTLAKLAAHYLSNYSSSIALITIDTYRIAAVEQLKVYGEIMHLPVEVVITPDQLAEALERHKDTSLLLIDTAGRSPRDSLAISELSSFFRPELNIEKHLVLSAATRENELVGIIESFAALGIDKTLFTKVDECTHTGVILNIQVQNSAPLSYITNGQRVPEDLLEISRRSVAELIMGQPEGLAHE